jgi:hypothetical protein
MAVDFIPTGYSNPNSPAGSGRLDFCTVSDGVDFLAIRRNNFASRVRVPREAAMRELPINVDADAVIQVGRYLDNHPKITAVSIYEALRKIWPLINGSPIDDCGLEELIVESAASRLDAGPARP